MEPLTKNEIKGLLRHMLEILKQEHETSMDNDNIPIIADDDDTIIPADDSLLADDPILPNDSILADDSILANDSIATFGETQLTDTDSIENISEDEQEIFQKKTDEGMAMQNEKPEIELIIKEIRDYHVAKAYPRARFFNQDIQGVADTLEFYENDSLMYMKRKPVVWNGDRQVNGEEIILHFNDSTVDHALLPKTGLMAEHVDEDFYNQLSGKKMEAWFEDDYLKHLYVDGNVQVIMLPMENDSTYNKLVDAESSYMTVDVTNRQIEKIKMWPEVTGNTTPLFLVKKAQKYLPNFQWLEPIRPKPIMIDGVLRWEDELGEVPEELDIYFNN